jgi:hypothetical protein
MELHFSLETLSLSLSLSLSLRSTFSFYSLLRSTFPSNSLYGVHLPRKFDRVHLSPTHTLSLYGVHFPPTRYGVHLSLSLYGVHLSLSLFTAYISLQLALRSTFPSNPLYGVYFPPTLSTNYIFLQLSTEYLRFPLSVSVSVCLRSTFLLGRALDGVRCRPGAGCQ